MSSPRWDRLAASLHEAGHVVEVHELPRGQVLDGDGPNYGMTVRVGSALIEIRDAWSSRNLQAWTGWQAWLEDTDSIVVRHLRPTKVRADVVAFVSDCAQSAVPAVTR